MTTKNITDYFNRKNNLVNYEVLMIRSTSSDAPTIMHLDNADIICPGRDTFDPSLSNVLKYTKLINNRKYDLLITIEFYNFYARSILLLPMTPVIFWIHDPCPQDEIDKIVAVPLTSITYTIGKHDMAYERKQLKRILKISSLLGRKVIFATTANCLIERAKRTYSLEEIHPVFLPTPVDVPAFTKISYSAKPSFLFLGRIDPIKRPWIFFELANRLPEFDFFVAGLSHFPAVMNPIIERYSKVSNLRFLGLVTDEKKDQLLKQIWAIINTSIHEGLPVSFLETLSYGKAIISCQNPDEIVSRFGVYTGEILGEGMDEQSLSAFSNAIEKVLVERDNWKTKGKMARDFISEYYSFQKFDSVIREII